MQMFLIILGASIVGSVFALIGGVILLWREDLARRFSLTLVSFAAGSLLGAAFLELFPEALEATAYSGAALALLLGIFVIFLFEKLLKWYHCHDQEMCEVHTFSSTVLFGDAVHNFIDGIVIALSFVAGPAVGIATTIAVFFHEVPQEIGDFGVLLHAGYEKTKVFLWNLTIALFTPLGAILGYLAVSWVEPYIPWLLAFAAGSFIYIATSDLLPELRHKTKGLDLGHLIAVVLGIAVIFFVGEAFHHG